MATKGQFRVECPHCGESFDADFWTVVRGDRDHDVKELILSGEFDLLICPKCEDMVQHEEPFLYIDPTRDILAFVMPESYEAEKDKWIARMQADYQPVKAALTAGQGLTGEPLYLFGLGALTALLESDRDREEETDVMEFMAREEGLQLLPVKPAAARELDLPFTIPVRTGMAGRAAALSAAEGLYAKNDALPRLKKLVEFLKTPGSDTVPFLKNK
ncbi:MAG: hypothetical protein A2081_04165 [Elusimicrobia bacterium GWC2_61_19]|nr:MAG: hypothetical protein A2081_04165 [Elusimicrobia bacterium GWC2_61_19]